MNKRLKTPPMPLSRNPWSRTKKYALAVAVASITCGQVHAQNDENEEEIDFSELEEVVVTATMRKALESAQEIKRNAATVVDSITAKDLGSFPDKSVAEALQRVPGITVNRFAASADTAHFSAEPSGVLVRGLNQVRTEFNGRDSFSANSSRGLSWGDISPELMGGVDTYKNQTAELIEGGLAGTVNMRTRLPFDQDGQFGGVTLSSNYGDLSEEATPEGSILYSNRWEISGGEIGFMFNYAHSRVKTRSQGNQLTRAVRFNGRNDDNGDGVVDENDTFLGTFDSNMDGVVDENDPMAFVPSRVQFRDNLYDRTRDGISAAVQFQDADGTFVITGQYNGSEYTNAWEEYVVGTQLADAFGKTAFHVMASGDANVPVAAPNTGNFTFDNDGLFQNGTATTGIGWWGADAAGSATFAQNDLGQALVTPCYGWNGCEPARRGVDLITETRSAETTNRTEDVSINVKWSVSDTVRTSFDVQYVESTVDTFDIGMAFHSFTNPEVDLSNGLPAVNFLAPTNVNLSEGGYSNPNNYHLRSLIDHLEESEGDQLSLRGDFEFDIDYGHLSSVKVGARYADRDQTVRWSQYNFGSVVNTWTGGQSDYFNIDSGPNAGAGFNGYPEDLYTSRSFEDDYFNIGGNEFIFPNHALLSDQDRILNSVSAEALGVGGWNPICSNLGDRSDEIPGTCVTPAELVQVQEETTAFYVQLELGGNDSTLFGIPYSGNVGVRVVQTDITSEGGIAYPTIDGADTCEPRIDNDTGQPAPVPFTLGCYISDEDFAFYAGGFETGTSETSNTTVLPSLNLKFDLTEDLVSRISASRSMARPDMGQLRNYTSYTTSTPDVNNENDALWIKNEGGDIIGAQIDILGSSQGPDLKPITSDQFDVTLEYYYSDSGSLTLSLFHKTFNDYIQIGSEIQTLEVNGVSRDIQVTRPQNGDGAKINGYELAYQGFFDFLPAPFDGFGVQANYTYINNKGITNTGLSSVTADPVAGDQNQVPDLIEVDRLEGLSDHTANFILMYEKSNWQGRLAYTWRSEYLITAIDCCTATPIWNEATDTLDGSIRYNITDNFNVAFLGTNLLNEETVLEQQVQNASDGGARVPASYFQNDRRYTFTASYRF